MCRPPGRPKSIFDDFGIDFGLILETHFMTNQWKINAKLNAEKVLKINEKTMLKRSLNSSEISLKIDRLLKVPNAK